MFFEEESDVKKKWAGGLQAYREEKGFYATKSVADERGNSPPPSPIFFFLLRLVVKINALPETQKSIDL